MALWMLFTLSVIVATMLSDTEARSLSETPPNQDGLALETIYTPHQPTDHERHQREDDGQDIDQRRQLFIDLLRSRLDLLDQNLQRDLQLDPQDHDQHQSTPLPDRPTDHEQHPSLPLLDRITDYDLLIGSDPSA